MPANSIPMIDLATDRASIARELHRACSDVGFFYVRNHGVPAALIDAEFAWARRFFALSDEDKAQVAMSNVPSFAGYEPLSGQTLDEGTPPDLKESFYYGDELPDDHPYVRRRIRGYGYNQWPAQLPGFSAQMLAYYDAMRALAEDLNRLLARSLGLPEDFFDALYDCPGGSVRLIRYPPQPPQVAAGQLGAGAHTDWGGITLLAQDDAGGLEVEVAPGRWIAAPPMPGTFVVNLGDMVPRWTNDTYRSLRHRVINPTGRERYSIAFFYSPDHEARIECVPTCTTIEDPPRYPPCTAGEHLVHMFNLTYGQQAHA